MNIFQKSIDVARYLSASEISNAKSGHTGASVGGADILFTLMHDHLFFNPSNPSFENRDRVVLSAGHAVPLYYALLHMFGFNITSNDLRSLRKYGSITPGHPEVELTDGIDCSTGPLGQGVANAVGLAISAEYQAEQFNTVSMQLFDNYTYCYAGDGCLCEGIAQEAISIAGNLKLKKLILLYDCNNVTLDGKLSRSSSDNVKMNFISKNWNVIECDGHNYKKITKAIARAKQSSKPTCIIFKTKIGYRTIHENSNLAHGYVMPKEELESYRSSLELDCPEFFVPEDVKQFCNMSVEKNKQTYDVWHENFFLFEKTHPELYKLYNQFISPKSLDLPKMFSNLMKSDVRISGRDANHEILNEVSKKYTSLIGGSADLASSTKAKIDNSGEFCSTNYLAKNICYGVREHAMAGISNGIALYSSIIPFYSTFLSFSNYLLPSLRMAGLMKLKQLVFFTHDGLLVGPDGPSHQPVEQLSILRHIPGVSTIRPANVSELLAGYSLALDSNNPTAFVLSKTEMCNENKDVKEAEKGAYVFESDCSKPSVVIYSSGIDLKLALEVKRALSKSGTKCALVSVPSFDIFAKQSLQYIKQICYEECAKKVVIECANDTIWYKYLSNDILMINNEKFGKSGDGKTIYQKYGFSEKTILKKIFDYIK